jgi:hypothetical protein
MKSIYTYTLHVLEDAENSGPATPAATPVTTASGSVSVGQRRNRDEEGLGEEREGQRHKKRLALAKTESEVEEQKLRQERQDREDCERKQREDQERKAREEKLEADRERLEREKAYFLEQLESQERKEQEKREQEQREKKERDRQEKDEKARRETEDRERREKEERERKEKEEELERERAKLQKEREEWEEKQRLEAARVEREQQEREAKERAEREERERQEAIKREEQSRQVIVIEGDSDDDEKERLAQPQHWQKQTKLPMELFDVTKQDPEYVQVLEILGKDSTDLIKTSAAAAKNCWNFCPFLYTYDVLHVQRIQNPILWDAYAAYKATKLRTGQDANETWAAHGSNLESLTNIAANGFNRSYNGKNATAYGKGAYFAKSGNFAYSAQHAYAAPHQDGFQRFRVQGVGFRLLVIRTASRQPQMQTCLTPEVCRQIDSREGVGRQAVSWEPNHGRAPCDYWV